MLPADPLLPAPSIFTDSLGFTNVFYQKLIRHANEQGFQPEWLLALFCSESGLNPRAFNQNGGASGLSQIMPKTLYGLGWRGGNEDFESVGGIYRKLPPENQIDWTAKYFDGWRRAFQLPSWSSRGQMYVANFLPREVPHAKSPDYILCSNVGATRYIYVANAGLDHVRKGNITVGDMEIAIANAVKSTERKYLAALGSLDRVRKVRS